MNRRWPGDGRWRVRRSEGAWKSMKSMRRWWAILTGPRKRGPSRWWMIDALTLGPGLVLLTITFRRFSDPSSFWDTMIPNFASELMGVWLGVRIIDYLISNQEEYHRVRRNVLNLVESSMELARKIRIKYDLVFLEEFQSRRATSERIYEKKKQWFTADELEEFAHWIEQGVVFEVAGRRYFQQVTDLAAMERALPGILAGYSDRVSVFAGHRPTPDELETGTSAARVTQEPWFLRISGTLNDFVHNPNRPATAEPRSLQILSGEARKRIRILDPDVHDYLARWLDEIDVLLVLRVEFHDAYQRFSQSSKVLTDNILEETEE